MSAPKNKKILTADFDYYLPPELIAQQPAKPRDQARLLVLDRNAERLEHRRFFELDHYLTAGDVLVLNNSRVIPARLLGHKITGGRMEIFLLSHYQQKPLAASPKNKRPTNHWQCLLGGKIKPGQAIILDRPTASNSVSRKKNATLAITATPLKKLAEQTWLIAFNATDEKIFSYGQTPVPPYIKTNQNWTAADYQTVYAATAGSVAAPTAGLHFTNRLLNKLKRRGIQLEYLTLHVGWGTFAPVKTDYIQEHPMHPEFVTISPATVHRLNQAKQAGRRIIAVGTTTVRALEAGCDKAGPFLKPKSDWINIFIYPGYDFKFVDAMITNFHLPKSTLLMLVAAFIEQAPIGTTKNKGALLIKSTYTEAIRKKYRFYSFGDAMLIS